MDIEQIATTTVKARIARTNLLSAFISDGDKEPSWDGHIYIYENESKKKTFLHGQRIAVQVKGKRMKQLDKQHITYHVAIADLQNYLIHGVVFFVIGIDDKCNTRSYYTLLHPIKIKKILETTSKRQKVNIHFNLLPESDQELEVICLNFFNDCTKQTSFITVPSFNIQDFQNVPKTINITCVQQSSEAFFDYIFSHEVCLYAKAPVDGYPDIPLDIINCAQINKTINQNVKVGNHTFYNHYDLVFTKDHHQLIIGQNIRFNFKSNSGFKATFILQGTLKNQIHDLSFILAFFQAGEVTLGESTIHQDRSKYQTEILPLLSNFKIHLDYLKNILQALEALQCKDELVFDYNDFKNEYRINLQTLIDVIVNKKRCSNDQLNKASPCLCGLKLFNIFLPLIFIKGKEREHDRFLNLLEQNITMSITNTFTGRTYPISQYLIFDRAIYKNIALQYQDRIISSFQHDIKQYPIVAERINNSLLEMLHAYDESSKSEILNMCIKFSKWLLDNASALDINIRWLNYLQSIKRARSLNHAEQNILYKILKTETNTEILIAAHILLNQTTQANILLKSIKDQNRFISFPIYNLMNIH